MAVWGQHGGFGAVLMLGAAWFFWGSIAVMGSMVVGGIML